MKTTEETERDAFKQDIAALGEGTHPARAKPAAIELLAHKSALRTLQERLTSQIVKIEAIQHLPHDPHDPYKPLPPKDLGAALTELGDLVQQPVPAKQWPTVQKKVEAVHASLMAKVLDDQHVLERMQAMTEAVAIEAKIKKLQHAIPAIEKWFAAEQRPAKTVMMAQPQPEPAKASPPALDLVAFAKMMRESQPEVRLELPPPAPVNVVIHNTAESEWKRALIEFLEAAEDGSRFRIRKADDESIQLEATGE